LKGTRNKVTYLSLLPSVV